MTPQLPTEQIWSNPEEWTPYGKVIPFIPRLYLPRPQQELRERYQHFRNYFIGEVIVQFLVEPGQDRIVRVYREFSFIDSQGYIWVVPEGAIVNGASIPRILWTLYGSPYTGDFRRASVVHDWGCITRQCPSSHTHAAFYDACMADHQRKSKSWVMLQGIRAFGPDWN